MIRKFLILSLALAPAFGDECTLTNEEKVDCGYSGMTQSDCLNKGCCYVPVTAEYGVTGTPWCYYKAGAKTSCFAMQETLQTPFSTSEIQTMRNLFLANINIDSKGGIVAAPDYDTPGGSYYYHWMRDGALTIRSLLETSSNFTEIEGTIKSYVNWVLHTDTLSDPNGQDVRTEPKFMLPNGEVFTGSWCRPQNDGPGLQAISLMLFAYELIARGEMDYVKTYLWTSNSNSYLGGAIKYNLDYVVSGYASDTCDLWEEIRNSNLFWNRATMKKAMTMGADFADMMGDTSSASSYAATRDRLLSTLYNDHWNGAYVLEATSRTQDSAVIVGFNDAFDASDGLFAPTSYEVASTVNSYNTMFCNEYSINTADTANGIPGVLYGRYKGDSYAGGNPWVLSTAALGQLFYRGANYILENSIPTSDALTMWAKAFNTANLPTNKIDLANYFAAAGDSVMLRLRKHVIADGGHLAEQIDRNTGVQMSAEDLTWSYAEVLNAMYQRDLYMSK